MGGVRCSVDAGIAVTCEAADGRQGIEFVGDMKGKAVAQLAFAETGEVVISDVVCRLVGGVFDARLRECNGERLWSVGRSLDWPLPDCSRAGWKLIGREDEAALLRDGWSNALRGRAGCLFVEGDAGVGKSALSAHFCGMSAGASARRMSSIAGRKRRIFGSSPCACWSSGWRAGRGIRPQGSGQNGTNGLKASLGTVRVQSAAFETAVETAFEAGLEARVAECRALLQQMEPEARHIGKAIGALVTYAASCQPIAIVVEDLHWADAGHFEGSSTGR